MSLKYRPEIDGLRAVAVVPVILFHAGVTPFSGGYIGVDVFFVISGFLITSILARELQAGNFSLLRFYERRARRILPALYVVLFVSTIVAILIMLPYELEQFGRGLVAVILFGSNILFWKESGYFAPASEVNPLLHTWSLAVEEQYYILFPLLLWVLWRCGIHTRFLLLGLLTLVSLIAAEVLSTRIPSANFYLLPSRAWELLAGSLTALYLMKRSAPAGWWAELLSAAGLGAIVFAILTYDAATPFPSLWTLVPVLGTVLIIVVANPTTWVGRLLSLRPFVGIGLISYSTYLWHQPIFSFVRLQRAGHEEPSLWVMLVLSLLSLCFGWMSWRFVERPFRESGRMSRQGIFAGAGMGSVFICGLGILAISSQGLPQRFAPEVRPWVATSQLDYARFVRDGYRTRLDAPLSQNKPNVIIVGDSFSQDFFNVIIEGEAFRDFEISTMYVSARCQIIYGFTWAEISPHMSDGDQRLCQNGSLTTDLIQKIRQADVVIFAARWQQWAAEKLYQTIENMDIPQNVKILVVGSKSFESNRRAFLTLDPSVPEHVVREPDLEVVRSTEALLSSLPKEVFINTIALVCPYGCPLLTDDGALVSYDGLHLTKEGAALVAESLFAHPSLLPYSASAQN